MPHFDVARANRTVELRLLGEHQIAYTLVGPQEEVGISVPTLLRSRFVRALGDLPKSGLQLLNPSWYQYYHLQRGMAQPVRFGVIFEHNFAAQAPDFFAAPALLHVLAWAGKDQVAMATLLQTGVPLVVVPLDPDLVPCLLKAGIPASQIATIPTDILGKIEQRTIDKLACTPEQYAKTKFLNRDQAEAWRQQVIPGPQLPFYPLGPNESQIRQMLGQFQPDFWAIDQANPFTERPAAQAKAMSAVIETIGAVASSQTKPWHFMGHFPAAILAFPSINPMLRDILTAKIQQAEPQIRPAVREIIGGRLTEQDSTTFQSFPKTTADDPEKMVAYLGLVELSAYTRFFDDMGYLHGSFHCSPYLRAPVKGTSLAEHHSFFAPSNFHLDAKPGAIRRKIERFSKALRETLHPVMYNAIAGYPGGLVALSDLPIEWMEGEGAPLAFTHDICRIPETGPTNLLAQFNRNRSSSFTVGPDILARTLVVCGAPPGDIISKSFGLLTETWQKRRVPWHWVQCASLAELYAIVNEHRPDLLIFDTHGQFEGNAIGTELQIGQERLNGNDVIAHFPQVPLVILSTCWGAPLYGNPNTIAHAFFEAGSFAVTTSLLPLNVLKGAMMYNRILNNLLTAAKTALHPNWSAFISHNVRTSYFDDLKSLIFYRYAEQFVTGEDYAQIRGPWQLKTMDPSKRKAAFGIAAETLLQCVAPSARAQAASTLKRNELVPEFLFYSTMGRADLIPFAVWNDKHHVPPDKTVHIGDLIPPSGE